MGYLTDLWQLYVSYLLHFLGFFWSPGERLFALYLLTAVGFAYVVYRVRAWRRHDGEEDAPTFLGFLLPRRVWSHPSAWLDVRYFFFHKLIGHFLLFGVMAACSAWAYALVTGGESLAEAARIGDTRSGTGAYVIAFGYMVGFFVLSDLIAYTIHYLQHKIPILWEFHKVHHSAEVMHPMSNFREHPIDNLAYLVCIGAGNGIFMGTAAQLLGYLPSMPAVLGVPLLMFLFNVMGYNLRHSHIWLRWPGNWSKVFPSPAHHHVHHSCHPDHIDKNFAFMFPVWDVIFKTYELPEDNRDVRFGVAGMNAEEMDSCAKLYLVPFRNVVRRLRRSKKTKETISPAE
ncbi:Sterol desaturase/sphingolipid hydroxylase, fatty acid hydroxylase superfamily [Roseovarius azorensis]|uniref:Sterol desaturase/sphingolipid hydroxylase, fatty acid hydroxylase superfamily n=1 Tax=Roseovarius azorensis TaxID=1287727 RepID=A0A1H7PT33_9RHOB|nr:sterol desaturase family protein [Roseovarius azorensis]SEL38759.1 Sterol desaturase/sphingolipid hydroxylase, fatty acid hydroxylase superfamily [Roseovarius azorensis]